MAKVMQVKQHNMTGEEPPSLKQKIKQQRLPAWQPILTAGTVIPSIFFLGIVFVPLGAALISLSHKVLETEVDYTDCTSTSTHNFGTKCSDEINKPNFIPGRDSCYCMVEFTLEEALEKNVYVYYGLKGFYQSHLRYFKSHDVIQLVGKATEKRHPLTLWEKDRYHPFNYEEGTDRVYAPRGAIANSLFNDTLRLHLVGSGLVPLIKKGIAWPWDKFNKFKNPPGPHHNGSGGAFENTVKPMYWVKSVWQLDTEDESNNGYQNEDLMVWMTPAAFPNFRKLYRKVDHSKEGYINSLPEGKYKLEVEYNFPIAKIGGRKSMVISNTTLLGGRNDFLGIAYVLVGCLCIILSIVLFILHRKYSVSESSQLNIDSKTLFCNSAYYKHKI